LTNKKPLLGDIWLVDLNPGIGYEQKSKLQALIISKEKPLFRTVMITPFHFSLKS